MRRKAAEAAEQAAATSPLPPGEGMVRVAHCSQTWAMLIKRVYEVDPLACPKCGGQMKVIAFIEPPQGVLIEKILRHCGLWRPSTPRPPPIVDDWGLSLSSPWSATEDFSESSTESSVEPGDWTYVDIDTFEANVDEFEAAF